jgi:hypothetical protein
MSKQLAIASFDLAKLSLQTLGSDVHARKVPDMLYDLIAITWHRMSPSKVIKCLSAF